MASVKILIEGFLSNQHDGVTCPTISLVIDEGIKIIVDPGILENQQLLVDALKKENLNVEDIDCVFITHSHLDHYRNIGMFAQAKTIEFFGIWDQGRVTDWPEQFTQDIRIIKTPGHNYDALSLLVKTQDGVVAIVGDVFWQKDSPKVDPYATDTKALSKSRELILKQADFIIPGHGGMYNNL